MKKKIIIKDFRLNLNRFNLESNKELDVVEPVLDGVQQPPIQQPPIQQVEIN